MLRPARKAETVKRSTIVHRQERRIERIAHNAETSDIRAQIMERARGRCECSPDCPGSADEYDHAHGRLLEQTLETGWALSRECHRRKTEHKPNRAHWYALRAAHCDRHGYAEQAKEERRLMEAAKMKAALPF